MGVIATAWTKRSLLDYDIIRTHEAQLKDPDTAHYMEAKTVLTPKLDEIRKTLPEEIQRMIGSDFIRVAIMFTLTSGLKEWYASKHDMYHLTYMMDIATHTGDSVLNFAKILNILSNPQSGPMTSFRILTAFVTASLAHTGLTTARIHETMMEKQISANTREGVGFGSGFVDSWGVIITKVVLWSATATEIACIYALDQPHTTRGLQLLTWLPPYLISTIEMQHLDDAWSTPRLFGMGFIIAGATLHVISRVALGDLATFPVMPSTQRSLYVPPSMVNQGPNAPKQRTWSLRPSHKLVTSGPFHYVRHPMFTGVLISFVGTGLLYLSEGSVLRAFTDNFLPPSSSVPLAGRGGVGEFVWKDLDGVQVERFL
ncbi:hypothetical protein EIP91_009633 [Steccherinum ochraceum]|uniref:Protein-S-isoprenylcysteine O-methyltransferase n=1 Tax=Steccherinum ochraceum TaxID=92696 RepID=A0A4R0R1F1_9APHY|nr:hypothetical protein EIP91_009633 [Steccherinum ochraceum]